MLNLHKLSVAEEEGIIIWPVIAELRLEIEVEGVWLLKGAGSCSRSCVEIAEFEIGE